MLPSFLKLTPSALFFALLIKNVSAVDRTSEAGEAAIDGTILFSLPAGFHP